MTKRLISLILTIVMIIGCFPVISFAEEIHVATVEINFNGAVVKDQVLEQGGTVYAPLYWLTYYGLLKCREHDTEYEYYLPDQKTEKNFAKRIFISKENDGFTICLYFSDGDILKSMSERYDWIKELLTTDYSDKNARQVLETLYYSWTGYRARKWERIRGNYVPIYEGEFTERFEHNDQTWVPLEELLPLMNAQVSLSKKTGRIHIKPHTMTLSQAVYHANVGDVLFDRKVHAKYTEYAEPAAYVISTIRDKRWDRLDMKHNAGTIEDYEDIFCGYLVDDEAYLNTFGIERTPRTAAMNFMKDLFEGESTVLDVVESFFDAGSAVELIVESDMELFEKAKKTELKGAGALKAAAAIYDYFYTYCMLVEDHREMLGAVYNYDLEQATSKKARKEVMNRPSFLAATRVQQMYSDEAAEAVTGAAWETLESIVFEEVADMMADGITKTIPWIAVYDATAEVLEALGILDFQIMRDIAVLELMQNAIDKSYQVYLARMISGEFDTESLNDLRLSAIMALLASRNTFTTFSPDGREKELAAIDENLSRFYLAADAVGVDSEDYYDKTMQKLQDSLENLRLDYSDVTTLAELSMMSAALDAIDWMDGLCWKVEDTDDDEQGELVYKYYTTDSAAETVRVILDINDYYTDYEDYWSEDEENHDSYNCPNLRKQQVFGDADRMLEELDEYFIGRDGFMFVSSGDVDQDGKMDRIYAVYDVAQRWTEDFSDEQLYFADPVITILVAKRQDRGLDLVVSRLEGQPVEFDPEAEAHRDSYLQDLPYSVEGNLLEIQGYGYRYDAKENRYIFRGMDNPGGESYSVESFLSGDLDVLTGAGGSLHYPDADDPYWAEGSLNGEDIHILFEEGSEGIHMLRVIHNGGELTISNSATTAMNLAQLKENLDRTIWMEDDMPQFGPDRTIIWPDVYPVHGPDGEIVWYETYFYWMNSLTDQIYQVTLAVDSEAEDAEIVSITFWHELEPTWNLIHHLAGVS